MDFIPDMQSVYEFVVIGIGIKYIARNRIGKWVDKKIDEEPEKIGRFKALWQHEQQRAGGKGHNASSPLQCWQDKCAQL
jgi:hypothetical protein